MRPVRMLTGISATVNVRVAVSTSSMKMPPMRPAVGISFVLFGPTHIRAKCGMTRPTQPMVPEMHTELAVIRVAQAMAIFRMTLILAPRLLASVSPMESMSSHQLIANRMTAGTSIVGSTPPISGRVTYENEPIVQYVMAASSVSGSATYLMKPRMELIAPPTMTPDRTSMMLELLFMTVGISTVSVTAMIPPTKAKPERTNPEKPIRMAMAAPIQAPLETPKKSGEMSGFLKILWYDTPDMASMIPTRIDAVMRGRRSPMTTFRVISEYSPPRWNNSPNRTSMLSLAEIGYFPAHRATTTKPARIASKSRSKPTA